jgi:hypothetical protein
MPAGNIPKRNISLFINSILSNNSPTPTAAQRINKPKRIFITRGIEKLAKSLRRTFAGGK